MSNWNIVSATKEALNNNTLIIDLYNKKVHSKFSMKKFSSGEPFPEYINSFLFPAFFYYQEYLNHKIITAHRYYEEVLMKKGIVINV